MSHINLNYNDIQYVKHGDIHSLQESLKYNSELCIVHLNIRSLHKGFDQFIILLKDILCHIDVIILTEINTQENHLYQYHIKGFNMSSNTRVKKKGGGIIMYVRQEHTIEYKNINGKTFEMILGKLHYTNKIINILATYRLHSNKNIYIKELSEVLSRVPTTEYIIYMGDININLKSKGIATSIRSYENLLSSQGLVCGIRDYTTVK